MNKIKKIATGTLSLIVTIFVAATLLMIPIGLGAWSLLQVLELIGVK